MLYRALAGQLPFDGTIREVLKAKQEREPSFPSEWARDVPADLDRLCGALLARDPALRPGYEEILNCLHPSQVHAAVPAKPITLAPPRSNPGAPFFGREGELRILFDTARDTRRGQPMVTLLKAPPGAGKTALLDRFAEDLVKASNALVLSGRCYPRESVPYKAFDAVIDALSRHLRKLGPSGTEPLLPRNVAALVRLFPVLERVEGICRAPRCGRFDRDPGGQRPLAFSALKELFGRIADRQPLVIRVDDLQWGDLDSAELLLSVLAPPDAPALMFVGAYRGEPADLGPMLPRMLAAGNFAGAPSRSREGVARRDMESRQPSMATPSAAIWRQLELESLDSESAISLALDVLDACDDLSWSAAKTIVREAGGNPLLIQELSRHFAEMDDEEWPDVESRARSTLEQLALARVSQLAEPERALLLALAAKGGPLETPMLARVSGLQDQAQRILEQLAQARLVRSLRRPGTAAFELIHEGFQKVLLESLTAAQSRRIHRKLATELSLSNQAEPEAMAFHLKAAGEFRLAAEQAIRAAEKAERSLAFDRAAGFLDLALELGPGDVAERWELMVRRGNVLAQAGRVEEAVEQLLAGARVAPLLEAVRITKRAAELRLFNSQVDALFSPEHEGGILLFEGISREEVQELLNQSSILAAPKGEKLISREQAPGCFYVVIAGAVELKKPDGSQAGHLGEGAVLGAVAFLMRSPLVVDIYASTDDVRLLALSQDFLDQLTGLNPRLALRLVLNLSRVICDKVTGVRERALKGSGTS